MDRPRPPCAEPVVSGSAVAAVASIPSSIASVINDTPSELASTQSSENLTYYITGTLIYALSRVA